MVYLWEIDLDEAFVGVAKHHPESARGHVLVLFHEQNFLTDSKRFRAVARAHFFSLLRCLGGVYHGTLFFAGFDLEEDLGTEYGQVPLS